MHTLLTSPIRSASARGDHLTRENHFLGPVLTDQPRQTLGPAESGYQSESDLGQAEHRVRRRVNEIAGQRDFTAAAERIPVDGGHHRDRQELQPTDNVVAGLGKSFGLQGIESGQFGDVGAGDKCLFPGTGQDQYPDEVIF